MRGASCVEEDYSVFGDDGLNGDEDDDDADAVDRDAFLPAEDSLWDLAFELNTENGASDVSSWDHSGPPLITSPPSESKMAATACHALSSLLVQLSLPAHLDHTDGKKNCVNIVTNGKLEVSETEVCPFF